MEKTYGRCDAIRIQDASGEISGRDSYMHAKKQSSFTVPRGSAQLCVLARLTDMNTADSQSRDFVLPKQAVHTPYS